MGAGDDQHCFHCGLPLPEEGDFPVTIRGEERKMCCRGCQAVSQAIVDGGLESFYDHRTENPRKADELIPEELQRFELYDEDAVQASFVKVAEGDRRTASLILEGITCAACVWLNERHVRALPGVLAFDVNYTTHRARVEWDNAQLHLSDILKAITSIGYVAHPFDPGRQEAIYKKERKRALRRLAIAGVCAMQVMMLAVALYSGDYYGMDAKMQTFMRWVSMLLAAPVVFYASTDFFKNAWRDLKRFQVSMDVPVALAIGGAFTASVWTTVTGGHEVYFDSVTMFSFFLLSSRFLEMGARHRAGQAAEALVRLLPATATRLVDGSEAVVSVSDLAPGDRVLVRPGETVPADGVIVEGVSSVDESLLTGESLPQVRRRDDAIVGGSLNVESPLVMRIDKTGDDTVVSGIVQLLERAQSEKPKIARYADRIAGWFVSAVLLLATAVAIFWWQHDPDAAFAITLSVLVVTCPCALSLATPVAITAATGTLTKMGLLVTRGHAIETMARVTQLVFDKTGTLTRGRLQLLAISPMDGRSEEELLAIAAALEAQSEHPVARVIARHGSYLEADHVQSTPGQGIEGHVDGRYYRIGTPAYVAALSAVEPPERDSVNTQVYLGDSDGILACFELGDELRDNAPAVIDGLRGMQIEPHLLSGDAAKPVAAIADTLAIDRRVSGASPQSKLDYVRGLQEKGEVVAMVGDGVNDAPVLAGSDVSVAMGGGTELAHASADFVMLSDRVENLLGGVRMSRKTMRIIRQNLAWALVYNVAALPLAAAGFVAPWMAALGMSASSLVVVANALRLRNTTGHSL
jgi:Cu2+-exporting ATPase